MNNFANKKDTVFCIYCGNENSIDSKFCISCGKKIENIEIADTPAFAETEDTIDNIPAFAALDSAEVMSVSEDKNDEAPAFDAAEESAPAFAFADENSAPAFSEVSDSEDASQSDAAIIQSAKIKPLEKATVPAFGAVEENAEEVKKEEPVTEEKKAKRAYTEEDFAFATGLPEWSLEPPQVMVRRHRS